MFRRSNLVKSIVVVLALTWLVFRVFFPRLLDAKLQIFYQPEKVASIRAQLRGEWFTVPRENIPEVLSALQPTDYISSETKCEVFADIDIESKSGQTYQVFVHTSPAGFDVHTRHFDPNLREQPFIEFSGRDRQKLQKILQEIESKVTPSTENKDTTAAAAPVP